MSLPLLLGGWERQCKWKLNSFHGLQINASRMLLTSVKEGENDIRQRLTEKISQQLKIHGSKVQKKEKKKHTTPGIRWSSPTQLLVRRLVAYLWESGRDPEFSTICGRMYWYCWIAGSILPWPTTLTHLNVNLSYPGVHINLVSSLNRSMTTCNVDQQCPVIYGYDWSQ